MLVKGISYSWVLPILNHANLVSELEVNKALVAETTGSVPKLIPPSNRLKQQRRDNFTLDLVSE